MRATAAVTTVAVAATIAAIAARRAHGPSRGDAEGDSTCKWR